LTPPLSVIVRLVGGGPALERCLSRLVPQAERLGIEVIVSFDSTVSGVDMLQHRFPHVRFVDMGPVGTQARPGSLGAEHELYDRRTSCGLASAQADIVALLEDYGAPAADWCEQVLSAHERLPHAVIGGAVEHDARGALNWAVYLLDFGRYQLPLARGPASYLTDVNVSYKRDALEQVRALWADRYNEVTVHWALASSGVTLWQEPAIVVCEDRGRLELGGLLRERIAWGRLFGATRARVVPFKARIALALASPLLPLVLVARTLRRAFTQKRQRVICVLVLPHLLLLATAWSIGEALGYATGREFR
jgi:hypothetical protein